MDRTIKAAIALGALVALGLAVMGLVLGASALRIKAYERVVSVKGLSEKEVPADVAVWPIRFTATAFTGGALWATGF